MGWYTKWAIYVLMIVIVITACSNGVNLTDGMDGLAAGVCGISALTFAILALSLGRISAGVMAAAVAGACLGFLPWNFNPAKVFMGDSGALVIGLIMAGSTISVTGQVDPGTVDPKQFIPAFIPLLIPFAVLLIPLLDFVMAVTRRLINGKSPFEADRKHLHHRLLDMGHSHLRAVLILYAWTTVASVGALLFMFVRSSVAAGIVLAGFIVTTFLTLAPLARKRKTDPAVTPKETTP
jgi:UDP-GlcNAc:undecaprenyl-phosphate GlcNAc-1-phosphate transferase